MGHIFTNKVIDFINQDEVFLGEGRNIARLELDTKPHIRKLTTKAIGKYWIPTEFPYTDDSKDYVNMSNNLQNLYMKNLKFQTLLDSVASRATSEVFYPITTDPHLARWWEQHTFFEGMHSETYAELLKALPVDKLAIFDDIMINDNILDRARDIVDRFEDTVEWNARYVLNVNYNEEKHKKSIVMSLIALHILEAVLFKSSFLTSFAFKENNLMSVTADAIARISLDETGHYGLVTYLINYHMSKPNWKYIFEDNKDEILDMYKTAANADYKWIEYLFEDKPQLLGISENILKQYVKYNTNKVLRSIKMPQIFEKTYNPCSWADKYDNPGSFQVAQKEKVNTNYTLGIINRSMTSSNWNNLKQKY